MVTTSGGAGGKCPYHDRITCGNINNLFMAYAVDAELTNEALNNEDRAPPASTNVVMISLPPTLFDQVFDPVSNEDVGLAFTFYESANLFPLANGTNSLSVIGSSVIGAIVAGKPVLDLIDPVVIVLPLQDQVSNLHGSNRLDNFFFTIMVCFSSLCFRVLSILCVSAGTLKLQVCLFWVEK